MTAIHRAHLVKTWDADGTGPVVHMQAAGVTDLLTMCGAASWAYDGRDDGRREQYDGAPGDVTCSACNAQVDVVLKAYGVHARRSR